MATVEQLVKRALPERVRLMAADQLAHFVAQQHKLMTEPEVKAWLKKEYQKHIGEELDLEHLRLLAVMR